MDKHSIIKLKQQKYSNRTVAKMLRINRKTVAKYCNKHLEQIKNLNKNDENKKTIQEKICSEPSYDTSTRKSRKYTKKWISILIRYLKMRKKSVNC